MHRIDASTTITDEMTTGATGADGQDLAGRTITTVYEVPDSDRGEILLALDNGKVYVISTDPVTHDDGGTRLPPEEWGDQWETFLMDATDTDAGQSLRYLDPGFWR